MNTYRKAFRDAGVEFGDDQMFFYNRDGAKALCAKLKEYPQIALEGHSTDYQSAQCLRNMVEDGIAILKVGPALTYGLREGLFSLSMMEWELVPANRRACLIEKLFANLRQNAIPMNMLHQYMPMQYQKVRSGRLALDPKELVLDSIA